MKYSRQIRCYRPPANRCISLAAFNHRTIFAGSSSGQQPGTSASVYAVSLALGGGVYNWRASECARTGHVADVAAAHKSSQVGTENQIETLRPGFVGCL